LRFKEPFAACIGGLVGIGILFRILAFLGLIRISTPRTAKLSKASKDLIENKNAENAKMLEHQNDVLKNENENVLPQ
jgi:hypothetical protein